jgi:predicted Zn-dependent protease
VPVAPPTPVTLGELGTIELAGVATTGYARTNGQPALTLTVTKTSSANTVSVAEAVRGALDALSGEFRLEVAAARRIRRGALAEPVGAFTLAGRVADLLARVSGVGARAVPAGAGWCAKGGAKLPVWATTPALRLDGVDVAP